MPSARLLAFNILLLTCNTGVFAQFNAKGDWFLFGAGYGYRYFNRDLQGFNFAGSYNFAKKNARFYRRFATDATYRPGYIRNLWNLSYGLGLMHKGKVMVPYLSSGPGLMWGRRMDNTLVITAGFTASAGISLRVLKDLTLGVELFTNANFIQSTHGFRITVGGNQPN